ncbi:MAG: UDP-N-acetylglucosamine 1-carboxyvinyltransferase [Patescibacteria group bacterium]
MKKNERFVITGLAGAKTLQGEIKVAGAKNAIVAAMPMSVLFDDAVLFENVPAIEDVMRMQELLDGELPVLKKEIAERLRASIILTGPVLARYGEVTFPYPGGCVLGERPIDLFLEGFKAMGAEVEETELFRVRARGGLAGARIIFPFVSVTATETLMLAAVLAKGETILQNAAMEPEIATLAEYINRCGGHIEGAGTPEIRIMGTAGKCLRANGVPYRTPPDRIEAGSFVLLAALAGKEITVTGCEPKHMGALLTLLAKSGVPLEVGVDSITVRAGDIQNERYKTVSVRTHEYPGFPTDLQAPMAVFLSQTSGEGTILETIFDGRFRYADDLVRMGADITVMNPHRILIRGPKKLTKKNLESPDLRAGLAYILAASVAEGVSTIDNAYVIDRGYEHIEERLRNLGLNIRRETV